jgi:predicted RNase H-like nuclease (RuvC/YqgF family)
LIVGIDIGTTTGIVSLDLEGNLILMQSKKNFSRSDISELILKFGNPVIIASDISLVPKSIEKIASMFSAKTIKPEKNLTRLEKNKIINSRRWEGFRLLCSNRHEKDALIAAAYAFTKIENLLKKLDKKLKKHKINEDIKNKIRTSVLLDKGNIANVIKQFTG